jgi:hypothetical protein
MGEAFGEKVLDLFLGQHPIGTAGTDESRSNRCDGHTARLAHPCRP